ncbi:MAG TPA: fucose isomerase [Phycisphaerae bacterium]|nr:fucose isomerase [Phycisphaerae bacterium]HOJ73786.1 fucose isomerase [Phycisphaerae bacterium]HOM50433.1 fucose isomerase [Phycisphaerae bacterium]HON65438.1 fucose isomerase [Phycisphaerae bacterium]HPP28133.1 fucose isomerase [Phycisphaerae bacterium]
MSYAIPKLAKPSKVKKNEILLVASGDLRLSANQTCWQAQKEMEEALTRAVAAEGYKLVRAHPYKPDEKHGFIGSQKEGIEIFRKIDPDAPLIVAEAVWQYTHHVLPGLITHRGPICTVANWSGQWPGLVGMLNLNGSMTKAGVKYTTLWSEDFTDDYFRKGLRKWLKTGSFKHATPHVTPFKNVKVGSAERKLGEALAAQLLQEKAIMGIFDEGCMGMYNAIIPDDVLMSAGVYKERLSQSALVYETWQVSDDEARAVRRWMDERGMKFKTGPNGETDLTDDQILTQCKMYIAALRIADDFGCATIGIQYQQGLKDMLPASDLVEGMLNNTDRPPVRSRDGKRILYKDQPLPHFNEVDECAGIDALMTFRVHQAMGQPVENTLHDVRWGDWDRSGTVEDYVWVFLISGGAPPAHFIGGWAGASSERQPPMYFRLGGGTLKGVSKPGEIVWSRVYVENGMMKMDLGRGGVPELPDEETQRRWDATTPQWPIMHAVTYGVSRDQFMAKHKANHIQVAYANSAADADKAMLAKASMAAALGMEVNICGTRKNGKPW